MKKKTVAILFLILIGISLAGGAFVSNVYADENYNDHSKEYSEGPGVPPEDNQLRQEPRTRFKDS